MNNYRAELQKKISGLWEWCLQNHPGKLIGSITGFITGLLFILFGFWQTIFLVALTCLGYYLGSCRDKGKLPYWLEKFLHRISSIRKK